MNYLTNEQITHLPIYSFTHLRIHEIALYNCREASTNRTFLCKTNPILSAVGGLQMNVSIFSKMAYEYKSNWTLGENKPNSNPIKANTNPIKANTMPKQSQFKPNQTQFQTQRLSEPCPACPPKLLRRWERSRKRSPEFRNPPYEEFLTLSLTLSGFDAILSPA